MSFLGTAIMDDDFVSPYFGIFQQLLEIGAVTETIPYSEEEAQFYDFLQAHSADLSFYKEFCKKHPGPILEVGAGTGRVVLALAEMGAAIVALEKEKDMVDRLLKKGVPANIKIICGDVMTCPLPKDQKVVLLSLNLLHHFIGRKSKLKLLQRLRETIAQDGFLLVDSDKPQCFSITSGETFAMIAETNDSDDPILYVTQSFFDEVSGIDYNNCLKIPLGQSLGKQPTVTSWQWQPEPDMEALLSDEATARIYVCQLKIQEMQ
jgi:SAM-dependent methyltransferase